jgi:hypothetical protein
LFNENHAVDPGDRDIEVFEGANEIVHEARATPYEHKDVTGVNGSILRL